MAPDPLTPYGNRPMVTPIVNAVNYGYLSFEVLRQITDGEHVRPSTRMIFLETPTNPLCKIIDMTGIRRAADSVKAMVVVDNTFATPYHQNPLNLGADLVVHSAAKALGGHNEVFDHVKTWNPPKRPGHGAAALRVEEVYSAAEKLC